MDGHALKSALTSRLRQADAAVCEQHHEPVALRATPLPRGRARREAAALPAQRRGGGCPRAAGGTSPRTCSACAAARPAFRGMGSRRRVGTHRNAESGRGRSSHRDPSSAWAAAPVKLCPVRRSTRSTLTSCGRTSSPNAKFRIAAAVYGPTPASRVRSSGQPSLAIACAATVQRERSSVVTESLPGSESHRHAGAAGERSTPSASARASRGNAGRRDPPASVAASPPRRGSRTGHASCATAGRARCRHTS